MRLLRGKLEISRVLKCQASFLLQFWGYYVLSTAHIINRIPSPVIHHTTPFEMFHKQPSYQHPKTFGNLGFALNPMRTIDKFQPKVLPSLFLRCVQNKKRLYAHEYSYLEDICVQRC